MGLAMEAKFAVRLQILLFTLPSGQKPISKATALPTRAWKFLSGVTQEEVTLPFKHLHPFFPRDQSLVIPQTRKM